ncbi:uncharacterized protein LOC104854590 isoform X2 [Fukomys damarensis]|nr:uncharacterized protein LOC104854590 isoform X2 [Fukomys damarensis]
MLEPWESAEHTTTIRLPATFWDACSPSDSHAHWPRPARPHKPVQLTPTLIIQQKIITRMTITSVTGTVEGRLIPWKALLDSEHANQGVRKQAQPQGAQDTAAHSLGETSGTHPVHSLAQVPFVLTAVQRSRPSTSCTLYLIRTQHPISSLTVTMGTAVFHSCSLAGKETPVLS